jgi:hypothetical protein
MLKKVLRKVLKIKQKDYPSLFDSDHVYFVRSADGVYEARNLKDGKVKESYKFPEQEVLKLEEKKPFKQRMLDFLSAPPELTPLQKMREGYFRTKGIRASMKSEIFCPLKANERALLSQALGYQIPPDNEARIMLFDPNIDFNNSLAFSVMGYVYDQIHFNPYFNPLISFSSNLIASNLSDAGACCNIGFKYKTGTLGEVDYKSAAYWFQRAYDHSKAPQFLCALFGSMREQDFSSQEEFHRSRKATWNKIYNEYKSRGKPDGHSLAYVLSYGAQYCDSRINYNAYQECIEVDNQEWGNVDKYSACLYYSIRLYIGLGVERDIERAVQYLSMIPEQSTNLTVKNHLFQRAKELLELIENERQISSNVYADICKDICHVYEEKTPLSTLHHLVKAGDLNHKRIHPKILEFVSSLAARENWRTKDEWHDVWKEAAAQANGIDLSQVWKSTLITGPRYNKIGDNSLPILGAWEKASIDMPASERDRETIGSYVPAAGIRSFNGLRGINSGSIEWDLSFDPSLPAMLIPEDFDVCLALVFGARDGRIVMPSLSIEKLNARGMKDDTGVICYKEWSPEWLAHTDFGRTLYVTDYLIGQACWGPENFQIGNEDNGVSQQFQLFATAFVEDICRTGGYQGDGGSLRVMLKPEHMKLNVCSFVVGRDKVWEISVEEAKMRVDGSYILEKDGTENRLVALNDTTFTQGRKVQKLTDRYNDVATLMPVFERARQMSALLYSLVKLKEEGFKPSHELDQYAYQVLKKFNSMDHLPNHEMVFIHPPFPYPFREVA